MAAGKKTITFILALATLFAITLCGCTPSGSTAGFTGDLEIDYLTPEGGVEEEKNQKTESKNFWQTILDQFSSDKAPEEIKPEASQAPGDGTSNGVSQNFRQAEGEGPTDEEQPQGTKAPELPKPTSQVPGAEDQEAQPQPSAPTEADVRATPKPKDGEGGEDASKGSTVSITIRCDTAVAKGMSSESKWTGIVPANGIILPVTTMEITEGETVFSVLCRARDQFKYQMEYTGINGAEYIEGINNLYEFDGGRWSGWMYCVNDWYPNYGCGQYALKSGDVIQWNYTCDLGKDLGQGWLGDDWTESHE